MANEDYDQLGQAIFQHVGGKENVSKLIHCMTRVRLTLKDESQADLDALKAIPGVLGVVEDETLQVVVGPGKVNKVAQSMVDSVGVKLGETFPDQNQSQQDADLNEQTDQNKAAAKQKYNKPNKFKNILKSLANIFVPMIPALVGAGIIAGVASILQNLLTAGTLTGDAMTQLVTVLNAIKNGLFTYLAIYTGINAATEFGATPALGGTVGAVTLLSGVTTDTTIQNLFNGQDLAAGQGGIIGVIFAVWLLSLVEKRLHKWIPDSVDIIITPTLSLLAIGLATIYLIMPIAGVVSDGLLQFINVVLDVGGPVAGFVLGALFLPMVMLGLHQILIPIHLEMINQMGSTPLLPILAMSGAGQVGAAFALWLFLRKDDKQSGLIQNIKGALPVGLLGVGEPLIYAVTLPLGRPFITACLGGGIGGAVIGMLGHVGSIAVGPSGWALIPLIAHNKTLYYIIGLIAGYIGGFILTYFFGIPKELKAEAKTVTTANTTESSVTNETTAVTHAESFEIKAPAKGQLIALDNVPDEVFSTGMMGQGVAIQPSNGEILSPIDGTVQTIFPTKHALGLVGEQGEEVLIHMGLDTVNLQGKGFDILVTEGQTVSVGDPLVNMDLPTIQTAGYQTITPIILTNSADFGSVTSPAEKTVEAGDVIIQVNET
ncbi:glucose PTS transporter subunit IIA [Weissella fangxianensis]|uniref:glucose PTS transporter subunit IIA n=1 Tax=Weissella fangxianensis TaxID=2953879 RepID=UPI00215885F0|nr:glucose PTS transporter subunit IIA [Weissella fangxianensis]